ncbi:hypothetical protein [Zunongwangia sp. HRR-M8]|uniref:hypothetical protein n=1 Tax=Zunongwangia sp. HRR-M8 TaxID=3015170 RepID=UPI0022DDA0FC|nr:hypothetical protein [Zunongwangia sp. HRR-M8]WBL21620.1 hypothetical protein PBT89_12855 [Zunongwangia sp. HRR-M8]
MRYLGLFVVLFILLKPVLPVVDYIFNYDYIVTQLCINRDRPDLACNGKCYLMQSLAEEANKERDKKQANLESRYKLPVLYFEDHQSIFDNLTDVSINKAKVTMPYFVSYSFLFSKDDIKPPIA